MNKNDLKKLVFCGAALGLLSVAQGGVANEDARTEDALVTVEDGKSQEQLLAGGCGGKNGCGGQKPNPNNGRAITDEEQEYNQNQGQGQGHSCANRAGPQQTNQGRIA